MPPHTHTNAQILRKGLPARSLSVSLSIFDGSDSALGYVLCCFYLPSSSPPPAPPTPARRPALPDFLTSCPGVQLCFFGYSSFPFYAPRRSNSAPGQQPRNGSSLSDRDRDRARAKVVVNCQNAQLLPLVAASGAHVAKEAKARRATVNDTQLAG